MYFRKKASGGRAYLQIVESRREGAAVRQQVIATLGRVEDLQASGQLERLLRSGRASPPRRSSSTPSPRARQPRARRGASDPHWCSALPCRCRSEDPCRAGCAKPEGSSRTTYATGTRASSGENYTQNVGRWPRRPRKTCRLPACGSRFNLCCTSRANEPKPLRISVWPVADQTRVPLGNAIISSISHRQGAEHRRQRRWVRRGRQSRWLSARRFA